MIVCYVIIIKLFIILNLFNKNKQKNKKLHILYTILILV